MKSGHHLDPCLHKYARQREQFGHGIALETPMTNHVVFVQAMLTAVYASTLPGHLLRHEPDFYSLWIIYKLLNDYSSEDIWSTPDVFDGNVYSIGPPSSRMAT